MIRNIYILILVVLLSACASPPREELKAARWSLARAHSSGASELAPEEYDTASKVLRNGEALYSRERYWDAERILSQAARLADKSFALTLEEKLRLEKEARKAEELRQAALKKKEEAALVEAKEKAKAKARPKPKPKPKPKTKPKPKPKQKPSAPPPPSPLALYTVGEGETLWSIATKEAVYKDALLWPLLYKANRDQIKDPRQIYPGQELSIPRELNPAEEEEARQEARDSGIFPLPAPEQEVDQK